jgi:hypothetical protein
MKRIGMKCPIMRSLLAVIEPKGFPNKGDIGNALYLKGVDVGPEV